MAKKPLLLVTLAAVVGGGVLYMSTRDDPAVPQGGAQSSGASSTRTTERAPETISAPASELPASVAAASTERTTADEVKLEGVAGVKGKLLPMREASELEKLSVRELIKMHVPTPEDGVARDGLWIPQGYDADSLAIKYGSMDVAQLQQAHSSVRAILDWQSRGPFTDKATEILPGEIQRGMEIELEWLEQTILYP
jgi:hypothetical protein